MRAVERQAGPAPPVTVGDEMEEWAASAGRCASPGARAAQPGTLRKLAGATQVVGRDLYQESEKLLDGRIDDPSIMVVIFAAGEEEDWKADKLLSRVNPSIGLSPTMKFLVGERSKALESPRAEAEFRRYHLNQWIEDLVRWIPVAKWDACREDANDTDAYPLADGDRGEPLVRDDVRFHENFDFACICWRFDRSAGDRPVPVEVLPAGSD